jgi:hypothetical protein
MTTKIYIRELKGRGFAAGRYQVTLEAGAVLVWAARSPFYDGARALEAKGITGPFEMWDRERPYPRMLGDVATAAKLSVREDARGMKIVPYKASPWGAGAANFRKE